MVSGLELCRAVLQGRRELDSFFARWYGPSRLTIAVVGDATADQVRIPTRNPYLLPIKKSLEGAWSAHTLTSCAERDMSLAHLRFVSGMHICRVH